MIYDATVYKPNTPNTLLKFFDFSDKKEKDFIMEKLIKKFDIPDSLGNLLSDYTFNILDKYNKYRQL